MSTYTNGPTWSTGHLITASDLNTYLRDNINFLRERPSATATRSTAWNIDFGTWTAVTLPSEAWDSDGLHDTSSNTSRMTIPAGMGGIWQLVGSVTWETNSSGDRALAFRIDGTDFYYMSSEFASTDVHYANATLTLPLDAGQYAELMVWHSGPSTGAGGLDVDAARLSATFIGGIA